MNYYALLHGLQTLPYNTHDVYILIDPIYNEEQEIKWRAANKIKYKLRFEKQRKEELKLTYLPNEDWWGSYLE